MSWKALIQKRSDLLTEARKLHDLEDMTSEQESRFGEVSAELDDVYMRIGREEKLQEQERTAGVVSKAYDPEPAPEAKSATPFASLGEQLMAVKNAALNPHSPDPRLLQIQAALGASEGAASDGGFLVQKDFSSELLKAVHQASTLASRTRRIGISANSNGLKINGVDETSRATGSRWGGVQAYWTAEAAEKQASKPKFRSLELNLNKLAALFYATDELLQDTAALGQVAGEAFAEEMAFKVDDAILRGTGAGMPLGIIGHAGTVSISKETNQPAATILPANLWKMYSRQMNPGSAEWYMNSNAWPALFGMTAEVGLGGVPVFLPPGGLSAAPYGMLLGRPIVPIEHAESLGTVGDVIFAAWGQYLTIDKGGVEQASSIHVAFTTDETCFRWVLRFDGQPVRNSALTPYKGTETTSPFVTLATRA